jgi:hypothetical protein
VTLKPEKLGGKIFEGWKFMKSLSPLDPICGMWDETALPRARPSIAIKKRQEFKIPPFSFQIKVKLVTRLELATG